MSAEQRSTGKVIPKKPYVTPSIRTFPAIPTRIKTFLEQSKKEKRQQTHQREGDASEETDTTPLVPP
jgi:hypothetical protein